jgi:hypothetical protein
LNAIADASRRDGFLVKKGNETEVGGVEKTSGRKR